MSANVEHLSDSQIMAIVILERTGGCISLVAVVLIFIAFGLVREARNVQNTFIVFASISNVGASIASIISMDGLLAGSESSLCQAQSFLFEMFMQSDPWWSLAMATNVFLVFYFRASPQSFKKWWWLYCSICYGGPFVIALALLLVRHPERGLVYGEATIWCWVDREWDDVRIYSYYMLIWICISGSILLYSLVGYHVFQSRNRIRSFSMTSGRRGRSHSDNGYKHRLPNVPQDGFYGTVITEVRIVHSAASSSTTPSELKKPQAPGVSFDNDRGSGQAPTARSQYFSTAVTSDAPRRHSRDQKNQKDGQGSGRTLTGWRRRSSGASGDSSSSTDGRFAHWIRSIVDKFVVVDPIKRAYLRTSLLFTLSVLVTWIPSSMNRIHSWLTGVSPFEYHVATAAVLPLQGLWNAVIFFVTSTAALRKAWCSWRGVDVGPATGVRTGDRTGEDTSISGPVASRRGALRGNNILEESDGEVGILEGDVELTEHVSDPGGRRSSV